MLYLGHGEPFTVGQMTQGCVECSRAHRIGSELGSEGIFLRFEEVPRWVKVERVKQREDQEAPERGKEAKVGREGFSWVRSPGGLSSRGRDLRGGAEQKGLVKGERQTQLPGCGSL